jgi:hypothetical protein
LSELIGNLEKRLISTREKIRTKRREITGGVVEDKVKGLGKNTYEELDRDLEALSKAVKDGSAKASGATLRLFDEIGDDIDAAHTKLRNKRLEITGGVVEAKAKATASDLKQRGEKALEEIEEDIGKIGDKLKKALE